MYHANFLHLAIDLTLALFLVVVFYSSIIKGFNNLKTLCNAEYFNGKMVMFWTGLGGVSLIFGGIFTGFIFLVIGGARLINKAAAIPVA